MDTNGDYSIPVPLLEHERQLTARPSERQMESSRVRRRRMQADLQEFLKVSWNFTEDEFNTFKSFYEDTLDNGTISFLMKTFEDDPAGSGDVVEVSWELAFVGEPQHARSDNLFSVSATLEITDKLIQSALPSITFGYFGDEGSEDDNGTIEGNASDCRENVSVLLDGLVEGEIYQLAISNAQDGPWTPYIYFALLTEEEKATHHKRVSMSNWFGGDPVWFRVKLFKTAEGEVVDEFISKAGSPEPAELAPPDLSLANASEITTDDQFDALTASDINSTKGLRSLEFYTSGNIYTPYSFLESQSQTSKVYRMFSRKFAIRQWAWGTWGDLLVPGSQNQPVTATGPAGAVIKWTRDGTVPTESTPDPIPYGGVANNAFAIDDKFGGIIIARCFKNGCRSPLTMIAVDKIMYERPTFKTTGPSSGVVGYCDLPVVDPATGLNSESGQSCNILYGGICPYEALNYELGTAGGFTSVNADVNGGNGPLLRSRTKHIREMVYLGWPIHSVASGFFEFLSSEWNDTVSSGYFNGWQVAPRSLHTWGIIFKDTFPKFLGVLLPNEAADVGVAMSFCGPVGSQGEADRDAWGGVRDLRIVDLMPQVGTPDCNADFDQVFHTERFDIVRSPLYYLDMRDSFWLEDPDLDTPPVVPDDPEPEPPNANPYDEFETYADGDASAQTMDYRTGTDWDGAWVIRSGTAQTTGFDLWESYDAGVIPEWTATRLPGYAYLAGGEAWEPGPTAEWRITTPEITTVYKDDFESYADGPSPFQMAGGTGWNVETDGTGWAIGGDLVGGSETWETYANGAIAVSNTGSNFLLSENWRIT